MALLFLPYVEPPLAFLPYDPAVFEAAEAAASAIREVVGDAPVEHVGSTAVPGLPGKNSVNLLIPVEPERIPDILLMLEALGLAEHPYKEEPADRPVRVGLYPHGGAMHFGFHQLIAHAALTRRLSAGTLIGSGTVSNADRAVGSACIAERRAIETLAQGAPRTGFMRFGDRVRMEARGADGEALFGAIDQRVVQGGWPCA